MDADFSIELGHEDPVLDFPWTDPAGKLAYFDLKRQPELIAKIEEAGKFPELAEFLRKVNSARSVVESAKCDVWATAELSAEEEIFNASHKFASYVDLVFSDKEHRQSLPFHESFARRLPELLRRAPEIGAAAEICVRRCFFGDAAEIRDGFYFTLYVNGYADDETAARKNWAIGLKLVETAILQLSVQPDD
ncbi:MAG: hypothetical protein WCC04_05550 [Terriglobales bacterium]